jgi:hypothetical protein
MSRAWSEEQIRALGAATDLVTAGSILGIGRTTAHQLVRTGQFPVPVLRIGRRYRVPVAPILRLLALPTQPPPGHPDAAQPPIKAAQPPINEESASEATIIEPRTGAGSIGQGGGVAASAGPGSDARRR